MDVIERTRRNLIALSVIIFIFSIGQATFTDGKLELRFINLELKNLDFIFLLVVLYWVYVWHRHFVLNVNSGKVANQAIEDSYQGNLKVIQRIFPKTVTIAKELSDKVISTVEVKNYKRGFVKRYIEFAYKGEDGNFIHVDWAKYAVNGIRLKPFVEDTIRFPNKKYFICLIHETITIIRSFNSSYEISDRYAPFVCAWIALFGLLYSFIQKLV